MHSNKKTEITPSILAPSLDLFPLLSASLIYTIYIVHEFKVRFYDNTYGTDNVQYGSAVKVQTS